MMAMVLIGDKLGLDKAMAARIVTAALEKIQPGVAGGALSRDRARCEDRC